MKLSKPYTITIETVEELYNLWHKINASVFRFDIDGYLINAKKCDMTIQQLRKIIMDSDSTLYQKINNIMKAENLSPFKYRGDCLTIGKHEVNFYEDGIKVGREFVSKAVIMRIAEHFKNKGDKDE